MFGKKVLILSGSSRKNGNTQLMAEAFAMECRETGNDVELIQLYEKSVNPCLACDYCSDNGGTCIQNDDMYAIAEFLKTFDTLVFATPVYYGGIPAKLKAVIDRFYALGSKNMAVKNCYLLAVAGRENASAADTVIHYYEYLTDFMGWNNCGEVCAIGYEELASISGSEELRKVRELALITC